MHQAMIGQMSSVQLRHSVAYEPLQATRSPGRGHEKGFFRRSVTCVSSCHGYSVVSNNIMLRMMIP